MTERRRRQRLDDVDVDPEQAWAAETEDDLNRDPGADLDEQGVPADDRTSLGAEVPEPERPVAPTDEPVAAAEFGTTEREQVAGEPLDDKLAEERPDESPDDGRGEARPAETQGVHVERATEADAVPPPAEDVPPETERLRGEQSDRDEEQR